jgi:ABC-type glycerol-3-phosphate transport system substrate-binding protein
MKYLIALLAVLPFLYSCGGDASAAPVVDTITWTNPTTREDGTPLTNLASVTVQWGSTPGGPYNVGTVSVLTPATSVTVTRAGTGIGTVCYVGMAVDAAGVSSAPSNESCKTVAARPSAPTVLKAT